MDSSKPPAVPDAVSAPRPPGVLLVCAVLVAQGLFLLYWTFLAAQASLTPGAVGRAGSIFLTLLLGSAAAWLLAVGHFLFRGRSWTRSSALVAQLFAVVVGAPLANGGNLVGALVVCLSAILAAMALFTTPVQSFLGQGDPPRP